MFLDQTDQEPTHLQKLSAAYYAEARRYVQLTQNGYKGRDCHALLSLAVRYQRLAAQTSAEACGPIF